MMSATVVFFWIDDEPYLQENRSPVVTAKRIFSCQETIAGRSAYRGSRMSIGETTAFSRELIDMRSAYLGGSVATGVTVAEIVREDYNDVRRGGDG